MSEEWLYPNAATPWGSSAYYSVRFAPANLRDSLAVLLGWHQQIRSVLDRASDPGVARPKLQWWREELQRAFSGEPIHPLSQYLSPVIHRHQLPATAFVNITWNVETELLRPQPPTQQALEASCEQDMGTLFELMARCHGVSADDVLHTARRLGSYCAQVYLIRDSGLLLRNGRHVLPADLLGDQGLAARAPADPNLAKQLPELLAESADRATRYLGDSAHDTRIPSALRVRSRLQTVLLDEIAASQYDVAHCRIGLTPVRKLWHAWRESRRR